MTEVQKSMTTAIVRYILVLIGGWLVKKGIVDQDIVDAVLPRIMVAAMGFVVLAIPVIWKYFRARFTHQLVETALSMPAGTPVEKAVAKTTEQLQNS